MEDCVQQAVCLELEQIRRGESKYVYEGDFEGWLTQAAFNACRNRCEPPQPPPSGPPSDPAQDFQFAEFFEEWQARCQLVVTFFQRKVQPRVKVSGSPSSMARLKLTSNLPSSLV